MISIEKFVFSPFQENTYILWDKVTKEAAIVDPGCMEESERKILKDFIDTSEISVKYLINTHCHIDHIFGNAFVKRSYNPTFYAPEKDVFLLDLMMKQAEEYGVELEKSPIPDYFLTEDLHLFLGEEEMSFIFTPGHSPGEYCIYLRNSEICISGDVLFLEGIGRTDLWGGDTRTLIQSIKFKLFLLPDETLVYPGHGDSTTIGHEKRNNPFLF